MVCGGTLHGVARRDWMDYGELSQQAVQFADFVAEGNS
jgi:hypothetical protein